MKKIALFLPDLRGGGAERVFITLSKHFVSLGFDVTFVLLKAEGALIKECHPEIKIHDLQSQKIRKCVLPLKDYIEKEKPNVILVGMWPLTVLTVLANTLSSNKTRVVVTDHSILSKSNQANTFFKKWIMRITIAVTYRFAYCCIGVSNGVSKDIKKLGLGFPKVTTIYNPIETIKKVKQKDNSLVDSPYILTVGRLKKVKDHKFLIRSYALIQEKIKQRLVILGEGECYEELTKIVEELGLSTRILFPGFSSDLYSWYTNAELFVLSSINEGFGNVIVEAMQCGIPIVSTDCESGPREILEGGKYGKLVPVGDAEALAQAMYESLNEQHDTKALKSRAADFSVDKIAQQYLKVMFPEDSN